MIRLYLNGYVRDGNTVSVDATPWFDQASDEDLQELECERRFANGPHDNDYFIGPTVTQIAEWMAYSAWDNDAVYFFELCKAIHSKPQPEILAAYIDRWLEQRNLARSAVDDLLNRDTEREQ